VGLKTVRLRDALHGAQADAYCLGDHAGRLAARERQDFGHRRRRQRFLTRFARLVAQQPVYALFGEALPPSPYRWPAGVAPARYRQHRQAIGRQENDPSPLNVFLRPVAIAECNPVPPRTDNAVRPYLRATSSLCAFPGATVTSRNPQFFANLTIKFS
jgi:hypothetical protein